MPTTKSFSGKKLLGAITALMDRMEAKYRSAFLKFVEDITNNSDLTEIIRDIRSGAITTVDAPVLQRIQGIRLNTYDLTNASRQAFASGGKVTASTVGFEGRFNLQNPKAIEMAKTLSDQLSDTLSRTVQENLIDIIQDAVAGMDSPQETVRRIQQEIGLSKQHAQAVKNYRRNLIQTGMDKIRAGKRAEQYAKRLLKYRAETIARTEVAIAVNKGQQVFWNQMKDEGAIPPNTQKVWIAEMDAKTCDICYPLNGMLAPVDGSWMTANGPYDIAHAHPRCRCTSGLVFPSKVKKDDPLGYEMWLLEKGDYPGHPFRGNQWTKGVGSGQRTMPTPKPLSARDLFEDSFELRNSLPDQLQEAIDDYTGGGYFRLNDHLRGVDRPASIMEDNLFPRLTDSEAQQKTKLMDDVFRELSVSSSSSIELFRGMTATKDGFVSKLKVGDAIEDMGFVSASHEKSIARDFTKAKADQIPVMFTIRVPAKTAMMAGEPSESELVLNRGTKMRVVEVKADSPIGWDRQLGVEVIVEVVP